MDFKYLYSFDEFKEDYKILANNIKSFSPDALISIARGGMTLTHFISEKLNLRNVYSINSISYENDKKLDSIKIFNYPDLSNHKKIVLIDDISDSGDTLLAIKTKLNEMYPEIEIKTATIFYKETSKVIPDFKLKIADKWIVFFWEE